MSLLVVLSSRIPKSILRQILLSVSDEEYWEKRVYYFLFLFFLFFLFALSFLEKVQYLKSNRRMHLINLNQVKKYQTMILVTSFFFFFFFSNCSVDSYIQTQIQAAVVHSMMKKKKLIFFLFRFYIFIF